MVSQNIIDIILKVEDKTSQVTQKVDATFKKLGDTGKQANQKTAQATQLSQNKMKGLSEQIHRALNLTDQIGRDGSAKFKTYDSSIQKTIITFNRLDSETQEMLRYLHQMSGTGREAFIGMSSKAQEAISKFHQMENATNGWNNKLDITKSKLRVTGTDVDSLKGKIQAVGATIPTYIGSKFDALKGKIAPVGGYIKSQLGNALQFVKSKIQSVGDSFSGLGGVISSVIGGIGIKEISDMTIGASIARDRIFNLSYAVLGAGKSMEYFKKNNNSLWNQMDAHTNKSLVGLDQISQAMSTINMSANASESQLKSLEPIVLDIGQRALLMGKSGDEAVGLMQAAGKGLNGEFEMLRENLGITKDKLENAGWDGSAEDIDGYTKALKKCLSQSGDVSDMMNTTSGKLTVLQKYWGLAGRSLGDDFLPYVDQALTSLVNFLDADKDGALDKEGKKWLQYGYGVMAAASGFATLAPSINPALDLLDNLSGKGKSVLKFFRESEVISKFFTTLAAGEGILAAVTAGYDAMAISEYIALGPLLTIIAAVTALGIAVYEVGKYFGWWDNLGDVFAAIQTNVMRLWDAFINNPDVQGLIRGIGDAWNWLLEVSKPVIDWLKGIWVEIFPESAQGQWDVTRAIIDGVGFAFQVLTIPIKAVITVLQILYPYMEQFYNTVLVPLGGFLQTVFTPVWQLLGEVISAIMPFVMSLSDAFTQFMNGQIGLPELISSIFMNLISIYATALGTIMKSILNFAVSSVSKGVNAAINFVGGILYNISMLPTRVAMYLLNVVSRIISAGVQWVSAASSKASEVVSAVLSPISSLPGKVYNEFMQIGSRIMSAGSDLVNKAKNIGKNIVDGILGAMGIHSPGDIQEGIVAEFINTIVRVKSQVKSAYDTAKEMGSAFVDGFGNPNLDVETLTNKDNLIRDLDTPTMNVGVNLDTANNDVINSYNTLATNTGASLQSMIDNDKNAYDLIRSNDATQLNAITSNLQNNMNSMSSKVKTSLDNMLNKNKTGLNTARNTTKTQLNNITSTTVKANQKMISSWNTMKNGIVSAADKIKSDSTTHFKGLESTIGSFYRKLQNPGGFGAGPGGKVSSIKRNSGNGFKRIANVIRKYNMPESLTLGEVKRNPFVSTSNIGSYIQSSHGKFNVSDLIRAGNIKIPIGLEDPFNIGKGAGWSDNTDKHVSKIKDKSKNWSMKGPKIIGKYATSIGFRVKDFLNGTPKIDFATFKQMAQDVFSQCHYDFYYDSDKYGNWMTAFQHGAMNCSDSTDALIAFAQACGLPASKVHGHWGKVGHFWANVAGQKMDTTGWMNQRNWTPSQSHAGPAPKGYGFIDVIEELKNNSNDQVVIVENNANENDKIIIINGEFKIIHEFENLPAGITAEDVARLINETTSSDNWIKALIKNIKFQKWDLKEKLRIEKQNKRSKGV